MFNEIQMVIQNLYTLLKLGFHKDKSQKTNSNAKKDTAS